MKTPSKYPTYDQARDGNRFQWIIDQAAALRERQEKERRCKIKREFVPPALKNPS